ncbi:uncharacterized protein LOC107766912 isoform X2 [Nicotiana tabacum]|uniref:Exosome complex component rrp40 isoform X2 n=1 Tax=Nicotiana tabacum TaxID=4097 RepID=A0A1S3XMU3_TOBAC|nr:PREDICTED: putative exosome complex component rrp40 isoform X2 [Nicotiana tabacum]XP_033509842.1 putative exosome complex component rrp40 isoform X2 [Nicotiana tomentosiformis]
MASKPLPTRSTFIDKHVVPGDVILDLSKLTDQTIKLGGGLQQDHDAITVVKAGILRFSKPNKYWIESSQKRYIPTVGDTVLGIVVDTRADVGTLIYARVVKANPGMNPELSCMDASGKAGEFGLIKDGYMFESSTGLSRMLLSSPTCPVLEGLGKKLAFEIAVGLNGRVWVNAEHQSTIILVANAIMNSESLTPVQQKIMVERLLDRVN